MAALQRCIALAGSQAELARRLRERHPKLRTGHLYHWLNKAEGVVSAEYCRSICEAVGWQVTPHDLRPDVFGPEPSNGGAGASLACAPPVAAPHAKARLAGAAEPAGPAPASERAAAGEGEPLALAERRDADRRQAATPPADGHWKRAQRRDRRREWG